MAVIMIPLWIAFLLQCHPLSPRHFSFRPHSTLLLSPLCILVSSHLKCPHSFSTHPFLPNSCHLFHRPFSSCRTHMDSPFIHLPTPYWASTKDEALWKALKLPQGKDWPYSFPKAEYFYPACMNLRTFWPSHLLLASVDSTLYRLIKILPKIDSVVK